MQSSCFIVIQLTFVELGLEYDQPGRLTDRFILRRFLKKYISQLPHVDHVALSYFPCADKQSHPGGDLCGWRFSTKNILKSTFSFMLGLLKCPNYALHKHQYNNKGLVALCSTVESSRKSKSYLRLLGHQICGTMFGTVLDSREPFTHFSSGSQFDEIYLVGHCCWWEYTQVIFKILDVRRKVIRALVLCRESFPSLSWTRLVVQHHEQKKDLLGVKTKENWQQLKAQKDV